MDVEKSADRLTEQSILQLRHSISEMRKRPKISFDSIDFFVFHQLQINKSISAVKDKNCWCSCFLKKYINRFVVQVKAGISKTHCILS